MKCAKKSLFLFLPTPDEFFFWKAMFLRLWTSRSGRNVSTCAWESASVFRSTSTRSTKPKTASWMMPAQNWRQTHWKQSKESNTTSQWGVTMTKRYNFNILFHNLYIAFIIFSEIYQVKTKSFIFSSTLFKNSSFEGSTWHRYFWNCFLFITYI